MKSGLPIFNQLQEKSSLMGGKLHWTSGFAQEPMNFQTPGGSFTAIPEVKVWNQNAPQQLEKFIQQEEQRRKEKLLPHLLIVPYLSQILLTRLDQEPQIMAADLCGNGLIKRPNLYMLLPGNPNLFPLPTRVARPYDNTSAQAAMVLIEQQKWDGQHEILDRISKRGGQMTKGQLSKLISTYEKDEVIHRYGRSKIVVYKPGRLLDRLNQEWRIPEIHSQQSYRFSPNINWATIISEANKKEIRWSIAPSHSLKRYASMIEGGPLSIWTDNPGFFIELGRLEITPSSFSKLNIIAMNSPLALFQTVKGDDGTIWAGPVMTWIESSRGDARQKETASLLYTSLINFGYQKLVQFSRS